MTSNRIRTFTLLCGSALLLAGSPVWAQQNDGRLETAVRELADDLVKYLKDKNQVDQVALGSFHATDQGYTSSFGTEIKRLLSAELKARGVTPVSLSRYDFEQKVGARFSCDGVYSYFADSGKVTIYAVVREGRFEKVTCAKELFDVSDVAALMGGSGRLSVDPEKRQENLVSLIDNPQPSILTSTTPGAGGVSARVAAAEKSDYAVEIWRLKPGSLGKRNPTDDDYELVPITAEDGLLFADLDKDNIYALRLINNTGRLAAATVTIDGLNMFAFSDFPVYRALGKVLVPSKSDLPDGVLFKGWHHTNTHSYAFQVSDVGESAVAELQGGGPEIEQEVGVITVRFAPAADLSKNETLPADEPKSASLATKKGPLVGQAYEEKDVHIGLDREVISIRYSHPLPP